MAIATGTALLLAGLGAAGGQAASAAIASKSAGKSAQLQTQAATEGARIQAESAQKALDFQKAEAARIAQQEEVNRRANYEQWAAQQRRHGTLGDLLGLAPQEIPGYVPLEAGGWPAGTIPASGGTSPTMPAGGLQQAQANFDALFPDATLTPDMLKAKEKELAAAGFRLRPNAAGVVGKIQYGEGGPIIDVIQGASSGVNKKQWLTGAPTAARAPVAPAQTGTLGSMWGGPQQTPILTPALQVPQLRPGTLGQMWRG